MQPDADGSIPIFVEATITDTSGAAILTNSLEIGVTPDLEDPSIALDLLPVETGDIYEAGDAIRIRVIPSDNVDVGFLSVSVGGEVTTTDGSSQTIYWVAPPVEDETVVEILVEAHDLAGNVATMTRALTVNRTSTLSLRWSASAARSPEISVPTAQRRLSSSPSRMTSRFRATRSSSTALSRAPRFRSMRMRSRVRSRGPRPLGHSPARCFRCGSRPGISRTISLRSKSI